MSIVSYCPFEYFKHVASVTVYLETYCLPYISEGHLIASITGYFCKLENSFFKMNELDRSDFTLCNSHCKYKERKYCGSEALTYKINKILKN